MKKLLIILLFALLTTQTAKSQISETSKAGLSELFCEEIVRSYNFPEAIAISYSYLYKGSLVCLKTSSGILKERWFSKLRIHDFIIANDTVFFCGEKNWETGVIGFFDINQFFNNFSDYYIIDTLPITVDRYVANLTKLVTFFDNNRVRHVFAIGYTNHIDFDEKFGCVVDWHSDLGYNTYNAGYVFKSQENHFTDVDVVGDYVVTVGFENTLGIAVRVFDKNNIFQASGPQNTIHNMEGNPATGYFLWNEADALVTTVPRNVSNNVFAIASLYQHKTGIFSQGWKVHLAELNVNSVASQSSNTILRSSKLDANGYVKPLMLREFRYNPSLNRYSILYNATGLNNTNGKNLFVEIGSQFSNIVMAFRDNFQEDQSPQFISYDRFNSNNKYILAGDCNGDTSYTDFLDDMYFQIETSGYSSHCQPSVECNLSEINAERPVYYESPIIDFGYRGLLKNRNNGTLLNHNIQTICIYP